MGVPIKRNDTEKNIHINSFQKEIVNKKEIIFRSGETNTRHYFVEKGLLRKYVIDSSGIEFNI